MISMTVVESANSRTDTASSGTLQACHCWEHPQMWGRLTRVLLMLWFLLLLFTAGWAARCWVTGVRFPAGLGTFSLRHCSQAGSGYHAASYPMDIGGYFPGGGGGMMSGREADHLRSSGAELKNACSYTSTPPYVFMSWCLTKHRDRFI
jgi:hypothetical protein